VSAQVVVAVGLVGGVGAIARFALDGVIASWAGREFPFGTLLVNILGAFVLGILVGAALDPSTYRLLGTGLIGAFTTFSTWAFESHRLGEEGEVGLGLLNFVISLMLGVVAAGAGRHVGGWI
jgi:CrcB protein